MGLLIQISSGAGPHRALWLRAIGISPRVFLSTLAHPSEQASDLVACPAHPRLKLPLFNGFGPVQDLVQSVVDPMHFVTTEFRVKRLGLCAHPHYGLY